METISGFQLPYAWGVLNTPEYLKVVQWSLDLKNAFEGCDTRELKLLAIQADIYNVAKPSNYQAFPGGKYEKGAALWVLNEHNWNWEINIPLDQKTGSIIMIIEKDKLIIKWPSGINKEISLS
jgi:hypothetical protein